MLKKMLIHGLIAAAVIATTAAVYAAGRGDEVETAAPASQAETGNGYLADDGRHGERDGLFRLFRTHAHDRDDHGERSEHRRKHRHDRDHDDD